MRAVLVSPEEANYFSYGKRTGDLYVLCSLNRPLHNSYHFAKSVFGSANPVIMTIWPDYPQYINADIVWARSILASGLMSTQAAVAAAVYYVRILRALQLSSHDVDRLQVKTGVFCREDTLPTVMALAEYYSIRLTPCPGEPHLVESQAMTKLRKCYHSIPSPPPHTHEKYMDWVDGASVQIKKMMNKNGPS